MSNFFDSNQGRSSSRVSQVPGGASSISFGSDSVPAGKPNPNPAAPAAAAGAAAPPPVNDGVSSSTAPAPATAAQPMGDIEALKLKLDLLPSSIDARKIGAVEFKRKSVDEVNAE
eukprot:gene14628-20662_t